MSGKSKSQATQDVHLSKESKALQKINLSLAEEQLQALRVAVQNYQQLSQLMAPNVDQVGSQLSGLDRTASRAGEAIDEGVQSQREFARTGGRATPEQERLIGEVADRTLELGRSDLNSAFEEDLNTLSQSLAPSLGFRRSDSPIIDRGGRLAREKTRQYGDLESTVRKEQANLLLDYPIKSREIQDAALDFQQRLRQMAVANRMALTGQVGGIGLGLSSVYNAAGGFSASAATDPSITVGVNKASQQQKLDSAVAGASSLGSTFGASGQLGGIL